MCCFDRLSRQLEADIGPDPSGKHGPKRLMSKIYLWAGICALTFAFATPALAKTQPAHVGGLTCDIGPRVGTVSERVRCVFRLNATGHQYHYTGRIARQGVDVGVTGAGRLFWVVFAPTSHIDPGVLRGRYVGASDDASLVLGLGANVLVGGSNRRISLQPLSVEGQVGINLAVGVAGMTLRQRAKLGGLRSDRLFGQLAGVAKSK
jgi:hypothetical protein